MPSTEFALAPTVPVQIDKDYLLRRLPSLMHVRQRRRTWDEHGGKLARDLLHGTKILSRVNRGESNLKISTWNLAKELVHSAILSEDPEYGAIRKLLGDWRSRPTAALHSTLGLWMAGVLGIPVTVTGPIVATILYGVAEAGGDWGILRESAPSGRDGV